MSVCGSCGANLDDGGKYCSRCGKQAGATKNPFLQFGWPVVAGGLMIVVGLVFGYLWGVSDIKSAARYAATVDSSYKPGQSASHGPRLTYSWIGNAYIGKLTSAPDGNVFIIRDSVERVDANTIAFMSSAFLPGEPSIKAVVQRFTYRRGDSYATCVKTDIIRADNSVSTDYKPERIPLTPGTPMAEAVDEAERILGIR